MNTSVVRAYHVHRLVWTLVLTALLGPSMVLAQGTKADTTLAQSAARIAALAATDIRKGAVRRTERILRQRDGTLSEEILNTIADSIVAIVTAKNERSDITFQQVQLNASMLLLTAGQTQGGGTPYGRAAEKLLTIGITAEDVGQKAAALFCLSQLPDTATIVRMLRTVAVTNDWTIARLGVRHLGNYLGEPGLKALRELHSSGEVKERYARQELAFQARKHGWP